MADLDHYGLRGMNFAKMTGVSMAVHAIRDAFLLQHTGVGCKYKAAAQVAPHDWADHPNRREGWTQIGELQLVRGCSERIGPFARSWYERRRPALMVMISAYFVELTGEDFADTVVETEKTLPCDMFLVNTATPNGGFFDGFAQVISEICGRLDWSNEPEKNGKVTVIGHFFHRYEADARGDVEQIRVLVEAAGLHLGPVFLSGSPYEELQAAPDSEHVLLLPYVGRRAREIIGMIGRRPLATDLPIGIAGTSRFVRSMAKASGQSEQAEAWITTQEAATRKQLDLIKDHFRNVQFAVFAETPMAIGLVSLLTEAGISVVYVGLRDQWLGSRKVFSAGLKRSGVSLDDSVPVVEQPTLRRIRADCLPLIGSGLKGVVGSSHELSLFDPKVLGGESRRVHFVRLECGFPSDNHHAAIALPTFGYAGVLTWCQRILDQLLRGRQRNVNVG